MPIVNIAQKKTYKDFSCKNQKISSDLTFRATKENMISSENFSIKIKDCLDDKDKKFTRTIGFTTIIATVLCVGVIKGFSHKFAHSILSKGLPQIARRINPNNKLKNFIFKSIGAITRTIPRLASINNIVAIKDSALLLLGESSLGKKMKLNKLFNWITEKFQSVSIKAFYKNYEKADKSVKKDLEKLQALFKQLQRKNTLQAREVEILTNKINLMTSTDDFKNIFNKKEISARLEAIKNCTNSTGEKVREIVKKIWKDGFFNKKSNSALAHGYITYISRDDVFNLDKPLRYYVQQKLTYNIEDKTQEILKNFFELLQYIPKKDTKGLQKATQVIINLLDQKEIKELGNKADIIGSNLKDLSEHMKKNSSIKITNMQNENIKEKFIDRKIDAIKYIVFDTRDNMGILEEIIKLVRYFELKESDVQKIKKITHKIRKTIKKATNTEIEMYNKFAEYSVGSAPTDVIGVMLPILCGGYVVFQGKNNQEKISATLKAGIPIIGGVGTTLYATTRMVSNFKGIIYGTIIGFMLNFLGKEVDIVYKNHQKHKLFYSGH